MQTDVFLFDQELHLFLLSAETTQQSGIFLCSAGTMMQDRNTVRSDREAG